MPIRALILDMDGVVWRGGQPLGDLPALFARLDALGISAVFVTNNATRSVEQYVERLRGLGVEVTADRILNSAQAAAHALAERLPAGAWVYVIGEGGLRETLKNAGFRIASESNKTFDKTTNEKQPQHPRNPQQKAQPEHQPSNTPQAVVVALDRECTYRQIRTATLLIRQGALFVATNPDRTFPTPEGLVPGTGAIIAAVEAATDQPALIVGKPKPLLFQMALERLGTRPEETLVVGDRLETDIAGGQAAGCRTALVLSGVTSAEQAARWEPAPDLIAPDLTAVVDFLERERHWQGRRVAKAPSLDENP